MEDRINNSIHALHIDKADHGPGSSSHFDKTAFNDVGGAKFPPQVSGEAEEGQQVWQIISQPIGHSWVSCAPAAMEAAKRGFGLRSTLGSVNGLGIGLHLLIVALAHFFQNVTHLVHPAALMQDTRIYGLDRGG